MVVLPNRWTNFDEMWQRGTLDLEVESKNTENIRFSDYKPRRNRQTYIIILMKDKH